MRALPISETIHGYSTSRGLGALDVGCGNGYVLFHCARHGAEATGVDLAKAAFELSRKRFALGGLPGEILGVGRQQPSVSGRKLRDSVCSSQASTRSRCSITAITGRTLSCAIAPHGRFPLSRQDEQEALNMNDGDACLLALVYNRSGAARLFSIFSPIEFTLTQLNWRQLLMLPPSVGVRAVRPQEA